MAGPAIEAGSQALGTGTATATTQTFTIPSGTQTGDTVCIYCVAAANVTFSSGTGATAFTAQAVTTGGSAPFGMLLTHTYTGSEGWTPGTSTVVVTKSASAAAWVGVIFSVLGTFDPALSGSGAQSAGSTTVAIAGVTTTNNGDLIIWIASNTTASGVTPGTITPPTGYTSITGQVSTTNSSHANSGLIVATNTQTTAGATGTISGTDSAAQAYAGVVIGVAATAAAFLPAQAVRGMTMAVRRSAFR